MEPSGGEVLINGQSNRDLPAHDLRRKIGYVIQNIGLFPHLTVEENIATVPRLLGWSKDRIQARVEELLAMVAMPYAQFAQRKPKALSGGQKQRIGLARALAADPPIVLLDEPFGALDPLTRHELRKEFRALQKRLNKTMVIVTHSIEESFELADRICLMDKGAQQQWGTPRELLFKPKSEFIKAFLNANRLRLEMMLLRTSELYDRLAPRPVSDMRKLSPIDGSDKLTVVLDNAELQPNTLLRLECADKPPIATTKADLVAAFAAMKQAMAKPEMP